MSEIRITHDGSFQIAVGETVKYQNCKNEKWSWSEFVKHLVTPHRTVETFASYTKGLTPKDNERRNTIKDKGYFVGGPVINARRLAGNMLPRQLLTLDVDHATPYFWIDFTLLFDCAAVMYSTHSHCKEKPRVRLIIPLSRELSAEEYGAVAHGIAGRIGIELFKDLTTFRVNQPMHWPSVSSDGEYWFEYQDGEWLNPDTVLDEYLDWQDVSSWPVSAGMAEVVKREQKKKGNPLEIAGIVGDFCKTYTVSEAIDVFLRDVYVRCDTADRYTYAAGSSYAGVVIYGDMFAFSNHATDPAFGRSHNAFDLVRIHKFNYLDVGVSSDLGISDLPSNLKMKELATRDDRVKILIGEEKIIEAVRTFGAMSGEEGTPDTVDTEDLEWLKQMDVDSKGSYRNTIENVVLILGHDPMLRGRLAFNAFQKQQMVLRNLPWRKVERGGSYFTDSDDACLRNYLERVYKLTAVNKIKDALDITFLYNSFHPVRDYLERLTWDGTKRVNELLIQYMGAPDEDYVRAVTRKSLVAAVARVFNPGVKFDNVLILVGAQGIGKSTIINKLGKDWYSDSFGSLHNKEAYEQIQGVWIMEIGELAGLKKAEVDDIKHFMSKREDKYRVAYGKRVENFPRQCVFFGTTNNRDFLQDPTGNRRFWPVDLTDANPEKNVFTDLTDNVIDQIWAEAYLLFKKGERLHLSAEMESVAAKAQQEHMVEYTHAGAVNAYLDKLLPVAWNDWNIYERRAWLEVELATENVPEAEADLAAAGRPKGVKQRESVCAAEIWCELLGGSKKDMTRFNCKDLHAFLKNLDGWNMSKKAIRVPIYGPQKVYEKVGYKLGISRLHK